MVVPFQLGGHQEALRGARAASRLHQLQVDLALVHWVHALIDLIHNSEGALCNLLQCVAGALAVPFLETVW